MIIKRNAYFSMIDVYGKERYFSTTEKKSEEELTEEEKKERRKRRWKKAAIIGGSTLAAAGITAGILKKLGIIGKGNNSENESNPPYRSPGVYVNPVANTIANTVESSVYDPNRESNSTDTIDYGGLIKPENSLIKPENSLIKPENSLIKPENSLIK